MTYPAQLRTLADQALLQFPRDWLADARVLYDECTDPEWPRLRNVALTALAQNKKNWDGATDVVFKAVRNDASLMWALFEPYRSVAVQGLLTDAAQDMRFAEQHNRTLVNGGRSYADDHTCDAPVTPSTGLSTGPSASIRRQLEARSTIAQLSLLDTFKINKRPIGDCTPQEANEWAGSRERDARWIRLLTQNLPPTEPIRNWVKPDAAQELWTRVEAEAEDV